MKTLGWPFDFIGVDLEGNAPMTGHANGLITLDIKEADDAHREQVRAQCTNPIARCSGIFVMRSATTTGID
jgi:hypothetical protein